MKVYSTKATSSIRLRVDYKCCYCQQMNSDDQQYLVANAESHGSLSPSYAQANEARQRASDKMKDMIVDIGQGSLQSAHLTCACSACGKRQPWASYVRYPVWAIVLCVLGVILVIGALARIGQFSFNARQLLIPMMPIPLIAIAVRNLLVKSKVSRLDPQYLPKVSFYVDPKEPRRE